MSEPRSASSNCNIADAMSDMARRWPDRAAIVFASDGENSRMTFAELESASEALASGFSAAGLSPGSRTLLMVPPGPDLITAVFALMKIGSVPVLVDPGLPREDMLACIREAEPVGFIGIPLAQIVRRLFPGSFRSVRVSVTAGAGFLWPGLTLSAMLKKPGTRPKPATARDDVAAVAFTSGSTGIPKGVVYTHGNFRAQVNVMRDAMGIAPGDVHLACVHIFALFNPALGVTTVIPDMDPKRPAAVDPAALVEAIETHGVTFSLGSPTIWRRLAEHCADKKIRLNPVKKIFMFGAPVMPELVERMKSCLTDGEVFTPYGATEALPLTQISGEEILRETAADTAAGKGVCVGTPVGGARVRIIEIREDNISEWRKELEVPRGQIGEITVTGNVVTREYLNRPEQTASAKIRDGNELWHRMGDLGYQDEKGRLWFCGRKSHRVETERGLMLPIPCETIFNAHPRVARSALVGVGPPWKQRPVLVVEPKPGCGPKAAEDARFFVGELRELGRQKAHTREIDTVLFHEDFPVDVRHNAKIQREKLASWAQRKLS